MGDTLPCPSSEHLAYCAQHACPTMFRCESYCIPNHMVCDGIDDCEHQLDEQHCDDRVCKGGLVCRSSKVCVHPYQICDGIVHCRDYQDDERDCSRECQENCTCRVDIMVCQNVNHHVNIASSIKMIYFVSMPLNDTLAHDNQLRVVKLHNISTANLTDFLIGMLNMKELHLINTAVKTLHGGMFRNCRQMESLLFLGNNVHIIRKSAFYGLQSLQMLDLDGLELSILEDFAFLGSSDSLSEIDLSRNMIESLSMYCFLGLPSIKLINLTSNSIKYIDMDIVTFQMKKAIVLLPSNEACCYLHITKCNYTDDNTSLPQNNVACDIPIRVTYIRTASGLSCLFNLIIHIICLLNYKRYFSKNVGRNLTLVAVLLSDSISTIYSVSIAMSASFYKSTDIFLKRKWAAHTICQIAASSIITAHVLNTFSWLVLATLILWAVKYAMVKSAINEYKILAALTLMFIAVFVGIFTASSSLKLDSDICHIFALSGMGVNDMLYALSGGLLTYSVIAIMLVALFYYFVVCHTVASAKRAGVPSNRAARVRQRLSVIWTVKCLLWIFSFLSLVLPLLVPDVTVYHFVCIFLASVFLMQIVDIYIFLIF